MELFVAEVQVVPLSLKVVLIRNQLTDHSILSD